MQNEHRRTLNPRPIDINQNVCQYPIQCDFFDKNIIDRMYDKFKDERLVMNILLAVRADLLEINIVNADYSS